MYYPDLSPSQYNDEYAALGTLTIGWLDKAYPYPQGETSKKFQDMLFEFCLNSVIRTRGFHKCPFCDKFGSNMVREKRGDQELWLGSAEIRVVYQGAVYAAPNLIYHYVIEHKYRPPDEFIESVLEGLAPNSPEYKILKDKYW